MGVRLRQLAVDEDQIDQRAKNTSYRWSHERNPEPVVVTPGETHTSTWQQIQIFSGLMVAYSVYFYYNKFITCFYVDLDSHGCVLGPLLYSLNTHDCVVLLTPQPSLGLLWA